MRNLRRWRNLVAKGITWKSVSSQVSWLPKLGRWTFWPPDLEKQPLAPETPKMERLAARSSKMESGRRSRSKMCTLAARTSNGLTGTAKMVLLTTETSWRGTLGWNTCLKCGSRNFKNGHHNFENGAWPPIQNGALENGTLAWQNV